jgi:hypothetical protein
MKAIVLTLTPILAGSLFITGCQTLPVVPHTMSCNVSVELLEGKCAPPTQIANDITYASLIDTMQSDRKSLRECSVTADTLRDAIRRCNQATEDFNKKIDALNKAR